MFLRAPRQTYQTVQVMENVHLINHLARHPRSGCGGAEAVSYGPPVANRYDAVFCVGELRWLRL